MKEPSHYLKDATSLFKNTVCAYDGLTLHLSFKSAVEETPGYYHYLDGDTFELVLHGKKTFLTVPLTFEYQVGQMICLVTKKPASCCDDASSICIEITNVELSSDRHHNLVSFKVVGGSAYFEEKEDC